MKKAMLVGAEKNIIEKLKAILYRNDSYVICGEYKDGFSAVEALNTHTPDILITEVLLRGIDGIALARQIKKINKNIKIILMVEKPSLVMEGFEVGVEGVILKPLKEAEVLKTLRRIYKTS